jgi:protein-tyrosine phosphatase
VRAEDFEEFDLILAMDQGHFGQLQRLCPEARQNRLRLFLDFAPALGIRDVPDPYYGGPDGFEHVLDMIEAASAGLLAEIREILPGA